MSNVYATQIIYPFLNLRILANHGQEDGISGNGEIHKKGIASIVVESLLFFPFSTNIYIIYII